MKKLNLVTILLLSFSLKAADNNRVLELSAPTVQTSSTRASILQTDIVPYLQLYDCSEQLHTTSVN